MSMAVTATIADWSPLIGLFGVGVTLAVNGVRDRLRHRQEQHARALAAVAQYCEMPYLIRRRRADERAVERARLSTRFADVQAELATCEALMRASPDRRVRRTFAELVAQARKVAGGESRQAWLDEPVLSDDGMNLPDVNDALAGIAPAKEACEASMATSRPCSDWSRRLSERKRRNRP